MVTSFGLSGRRRRYHPPPPPACAHAAAALHAAAASLEWPCPLPRPPWEAAVSRIDCGKDAPWDLPERNDVDPVEPDLEPSFALNLFQDGYSIGEPSKGMLTYLIGDDPKKQPYSRASKALFSDIEYGFLPPEVLPGIPCKFLNGSTVCEVRDYRFLTNGGDYSGDDFPKVNRVSLRLGTGSVVKDLSSIVDASWTYHDQLIAESTVLNALQPRLNLDPTSCLEMLCNSKRIDLGLDKGKQYAKNKSLCISAETPGSCKSDEFNVCKSRTVCIEDESIEGMESGKLNSVSVNCSSMILINNGKSLAESDPNDTIRSSCTLMNNSALSDSKESASSIASEHFIQGNELQAQIATLQVDRKNGQPQIVTVVSRKRKKSSNLVLQRHESKRCSSPNRTAILNSQHSKGIGKSTGTSNKERLDLGSQKVLVDQAIDGKDMKVKPGKPFSVQHSINLCVDIIPGKVGSFNKRFKKRCEAPVVNLPNSAPEDLKEKRTPSVTSSEAAFKPHMDKAGTEPKDTASMGKVLGISTISLKQELKFRRKTQKNVDILIQSPCENTLIKSPCENRSAEEPDVIGGVSSQLGVGLMVDNRKQQTKDTSGFHETTDAPEYCEPIELNIYKGTARCMENATLEGMPSIKFNISSVNYASSIHDNYVKSSAQSDPGSIIQSSENCLGLQKLTGTSNKQGLQLRSPTEMHVRVDQETGNKSMKVPQQLPLPVLPSSHLYTSSNTRDPCIKQKLGNINSIHVRFKEGRETPVMDLDNSGVSDLRGSATPSVNSFNAGSRKAASKHHEDKPATEPHVTASNIKVSGTSTIYSNLKINSKGKTQEAIDTQSKSHCERSSEPPCVDRSSEETCFPSGTSRKLDTSPDLWSCTEHRMNTREPDIGNILSEVILTTQRHGLNGKAARNDGLEITSSLVPSECFQPENSEKYQYISEETMSYYATGGVTSSCKIRSIAFHPLQYFSCKGILDDSHYTLCLLESQAPNDHQITVGTIYGDEHVHIATLPTYCHAEKFVDQFIALMKRDGYNLCDDKVLTGPSELTQTQQFEDAPQLCHDTGEYKQYLMLSPSVVNSSAIKENNNVGCTFLNRLPDFHVNLLQQRTQNWHTNRILQHMGPSFACNSFAMNLHQFPSVHLSQQVSVDQYWQRRHNANNVFALDLHQFPSPQLSQEVSMDRYWQHRHDVPGFSDMYGAGMSASSYGHWRPVPTRLGNVVYQWDLPAFGRHINNTPLPHDGSGIPWSESQPTGSPQMSRDSDDCSVTSHKHTSSPRPLNYRYLSHGSV